MKWLFQRLGRWLGFHFAPDNHVIPVLRFGRYHRVLGPGVIWIMPVIEQTLPPVKTSLHVGNFTFTDVLSKDNIPFRIGVSILFIFKPDAALKGAAAQLVRGGDELLRVIVHSFTNRRLRRLVAAFESESLANRTVVDRIEDALARHLKHEMTMLGLIPLKTEQGGVMVKEIVAPETFKQTMLDVKHDEAILDVLRRYPVPELVQLLNQVIFANSMKDRSGQTAVMMGAPDGLPLFSMWGQQGRNGRNGKR